MRDFNRDVSSRICLLFLKFFNAALYYEPIFDVIRLGYQLGFGNSHFEYLYQHISQHPELHEIMMPGGPNWSEYDSDQVRDVLSAHSLSERIKIEVTPEILILIPKIFVLESLLSIFAYVKSHAPLQFQ